MDNYIFVYGTLLTEERNHYLLENSILIGNGYIKDYFMFNVGTYPGIQKSKYNNKIVLGEVYKVNDETMVLLDELEEVGYLYKKELVTIYLDNDEIVNAYVYEYILKNYEENNIVNEYNWKKIK
ncbi:MAG: gamma-glutamylcyclotransferase [Bacilli bacterium]|nr:gamma-glutamylcyclotransferase [Bacilli bacterium]